MKKKITYILLFILSFIVINGQAQCDMQEEFETYSINGMSSFIEWETLAENTVICNSSDWQPSFFVNNDSLLNVRISGDVYVNPSMTDDDFIGFVFGYSSPNLMTESNDNHFYLFDWKKVGQYAPEIFGSYYANEGFSLVEANGLIDSHQDSTYKYFWGHLENENFKLLNYKYSSNLGWSFNTTYKFELIYSYNKIIISIDDDVIFQRDGCYQPGLFGLYSFNQNGVVYSNISIQQYYEINIDNEQERYCEGETIGLNFIDDNCAPLPPNTISHAWNFGDGSEISTEINPQHIYEETGNYTIELYLQNKNGCTDTIQKDIYIDSKPEFVIEPNDIECFVGDNIYFSVEASNASSYQWYYQDRDMDDWEMLQNNGYFSGSHSEKLTVHNVRLIFDKMKFRCSINGACASNISSEPAELRILDIPIRAKLAANEDNICANDSMLLIVTLKEYYNIQDANLRVNYDAENLECLDITTYNSNLEYTITEGDDYINISLEMLNPVMIGDHVIAAIEYLSIGDENIIAEFDWDKDETWFIDITGDTILDVLTGGAISINQPIKWELNDTISNCLDEPIIIESDDYQTIKWSNGADGTEVLLNETGEYWVFFLDNNSCISTDTFYYYVKPDASAPQEIFIHLEEYCSNEDSITFSVSGGLGDILEVRSDMHSKVFTSPQEVYNFPNQSSSFDISARYINDCSTSDFIFESVNVKEAVLPDVSINYAHEQIFSGEKIQFQAIPVNGGASPMYFWLLDNNILQSGTSDIFETDMLVEKHKIGVYMYSNEECLAGVDSAYASLILSAIDQYQYSIPSLVTANGDGINDEFIVDFVIYEFDKYELQIYDLLGRLVFHTNDPFDGWDGEQYGYNNPIGVYTYRLRFQHAGQHEKLLSGKFMLKK